MRNICSAGIHARESEIATASHVATPSTKGESHAPCRDRPDVPSAARGPRDRGLGARRSVAGRGRIYARAALRGGEAQGRRKEVRREAADAVGTCAGDAASLDAVVDACVATYLDAILLTTTSTTVPSITTTSTTSTTTSTIPPTTLPLFNEQEPNDTVVTATNLGDLDAAAVGAISPASDVDYFMFTLSSVSDIRIETFDGDGPGNSDLIDTQITLFTGDGLTQLATDDDLGIGSR